MKKAVLTLDWFVDFDPVKRKLEGINNPVAILGGGDPRSRKSTKIANLFPDQFADNGLPEGWKVKGLDQVADFLNGLALQKFPALHNDDFLPVIKIAELRNGVLANSGKANKNIPEKFIIDDKDSIFSWSGSLLAKFWTEGKGALNQHLFKVTSTEYPHWFFQNGFIIVSKIFNKSRLSRQQLWATFSGSTYLQLSSIVQVMEILNVLV